MGGRNAPLFGELLTATAAPQWVERIGREPLDFAPGERWRYSNSGCVLAGAVVERLAGRDLSVSCTSRSSIH